MGRGAKRKGTRWENEAAKILSVASGIWKRIPGSGAMGHFLKDANYNSDITGEYPWWRKKFRGECKYGYGTSKSMSVKREWITKIREEAEEARGYPCLLIKFKDVRDDPDTSKLLCFNFDTWLLLMQEIDDLYTDHIKLLERTDND